MFFQSRPGSLSARQIAALHRRAPLARLILLTGPWCDGDVRGNRLVPGIVRVRWHEWRERLPAELNHQRNRPPRTTTDGERLECQLRELSSAGQSAGRVAIVTLRRANYDALAAACNSLGWQAEWVVSHDRIGDHDLLLVDGWESLAADPRAADPRAESTPPCALLLGFSRPEDLQKAAGLGIASVIAVPLSLPVLAAALAAASPLAARRPLLHSVA
jgi:hypothetical protein